MKTITFYCLLAILTPLLVMSQTHGGNGRGDFSLSYSPPPVEVTATSGTTGPTSYNTLGAAFNAINLSIHNGDITIVINSNLTEAATATLYQSGFSDGKSVGGSSYTSVLIYPSVPGVTVTGSFAGPLIDLNGADNVTIDGRVNQSGTKNLSLFNTYNLADNASAISAIRFINTAEHNVVKYCTLKASARSTIGAVVLFSSANQGNGNSGNKIDNCDVTAYSTVPYNLVYSAGTTGYANINDTISNCNIYNFINTGLSSNGILLSSNSSDWLISGNNFYETVTINPLGTYIYCAIKVDNTAGNNFVISGNYIGGYAADHTGTFGVDNPFSHQFYGFFVMQAQPLQVPSREIPLPGSAIRVPPPIRSMESISEPAT